MTSNWTCLIILFILTFYCNAQENDYFQQHVAYDIDVSLNDSSHVLDAHVRMIYTNNSPDTLDFIWFHLWPNAYENNETAFARQEERFKSRKFLLSEEKDRGYIDSLSFMVDGKSVRVDEHGKWNDVVKLILPKPLLPKQKINIETPFRVKIPKVFSRLGHIGQHYEITQWYPKPAVYDRKGWHPMPYLNMGEFYSEFGTFDVKITLPKEYRIMATGDLINGDVEYAWLDSLATVSDSIHALDEKEFKKAMENMQSGKSGKKKSILKKINSLFEKKKDAKEKEAKNKFKTLHFHQENVHDFAWFADKTWLVRKGTLFLADSTKEVTLWSMYKPKNAKMWENSIEYIHDAGYWYSEFLGDYPYGHITAVDGDLSAGGGMEYPNITVISKMGSKHLLEMVIMHEVGHNWFYGILGSNERDHTWLDEGLNEFCNIRYWEKKYGENNRRWILNEFTQEKLGPFSIGSNLQFGFFEYAGYSTWIKRGDEEPLETSSNDFKQRTNYWLSYSKPLLFSWHLMDYLGEDVIDSILHDYYDDWKFRHPYPDDFFSYVKKYSDKDLSWYTEDVFYKTGIVDYGASIVKEDVIFTNYGSLSIPFEVSFLLSDGQEFDRVWFDGVDRVYSMKLDSNVKSVIIDPDKTLPDVDRTNNSTSRPLKFTWVFDQPSYYKTEIFWMPWLFSWNQYNGWTPGVSLYSGYLPGYDFGFSIRPMWDFNNDQLIGSMKYVQDFYDIGNFYKSTFNVNVAQNSGRKGVLLGFEGKRKKHLESYPNYSSIFNLNYHQINEEAINLNYYDGGEIVVGYAELEMHNVPTPFLNYYFRSAVQTGLIHSQFMRINFQTNIYYRFNKKISSKIRVWFGGFLNKKNLPLQYRTYLSGSVDPDFSANNILDRTSESTDFSLGSKQYEISGPSLHGLVSTETKHMLGVDDWVMSVNFDIGIPKIPGRPFFDFAIVGKKKPYVDFGLKKSIGPLELIIPLYQTWDEDPFIQNTDWLKQRMRVKFNIPSINFRSLF